MKSLEHMSGIPEHQDISGQPERAEWKLTWEGLKQKWEVAPKEDLRDRSIRFDIAIKSVEEGQRIGVPVEEIDQFAKNVIAQGTEHENYNFAYFIRGHLSTTHDKELKAFAEKTYQHLIKVDTGAARNLAATLYGRNSREFQRFEEAEERKTEKEPSVTLSRDATFNDLFGALEDSELDDMFWKEMHDNFNEEACDAIFELQSEAHPARSKTKVLDFFKEHGYSQGDVSDLLPIEFK